MTNLRYETIEDALQGQDIPSAVRATLVLVDVPFYSFEGKLETGQLVLHADLASEVTHIFEQLSAAEFPIQRVVPIQAYSFDDERSMQANNTSAFNYRVIADTNTISNHAFGRAIDINPLLNPYYPLSGKVLPEGASYDLSVPGTLRPEGFVVSLFKQCGWRWLGDRAEAPDYQHFDKPV